MSWVLDAKIISIHQKDSTKITFPKQSSTFAKCIFLENRMANDLKQRAISGTKWSSILQIGKYGISFFMAIILARVLEPEELGLIGMLTIFTVIAKVFNMMP